MLKHPVSPKGVLSFYYIKVVSSLFWARNYFSRNIRSIFRVVIFYFSSPESDFLKDKKNIRLENSISGNIKNVLILKLESSISQNIRIFSGRIFLIILRLGLKVHRVAVYYTNFNWRRLTCSLHEILKWTGFSVGLLSFWIILFFLETWNIEKYEILVNKF